MKIANNVPKKMPPTLMCDWYKISHKDQSPKGTQFTWTNWIARFSRIPGVNMVVSYGFQGVIKEYLIDYFDENFFNRPKKEVIAEYVRYVKYGLGVENPDATHLEQLHDLGYLPLRIKAIAEGTRVPIGVPLLTIENTHEDFSWLPTYLETLLSNELWMASNSATLAVEFRKILNHYAMKTIGHLLDVDFQDHDFSMRGMAGLQAAMMSGSGHLLSFTGTDTIPAIWYLERYYNADIEKELVGASIPATEHSVMSAHGLDEQKTYEYLIKEVYPKGFVSIVSDTYDFWNIVGQIIPDLKSDIMARDGKVVIRPDSGDPVLIICGDPDSDNEYARKGLIECLWDTFDGTISEQGYKILDPHIGSIYGDAITIDRCREICKRLEAKGFATTNIVFGVGSFTYQYNTRDTLGFAMKATHTVINGEEKMIFKDPKTDSGIKKSLKGRAVVLETEEKGIHVIDQLNREEQDSYDAVDLLEEVFVDGELIRDMSLAQVRENLKLSLAKY